MVNVACLGQIGAKSSPGRSVGRPQILPLGKKTLELLVPFWAVAHVPSWIAIDTMDIPGVELLWHPAQSKNGLKHELHNALVE